MSLRVIHIFLIISAIALSLFTALWIKLYAWLTMTSFAVAVILTVYLVWFIAKMGKRAL